MPTKATRIKPTSAFKLGKVEYGEKPLTLDRVALDCIRKGLQDAATHLPAGAGGPAGSDRQ